MVLLERTGGSGNGGLRLLKSLIHRLVQISFLRGGPRSNDLRTWASALATLATVESLSLGGFSHQLGRSYDSDVRKRSAKLPGFVLDRQLGALQDDRSPQGRYAFLDERQKKLGLFRSSAMSSGALHICQFSSQSMVSAWS
jgi:hypothetical protein